MYRVLQPVDSNVERARQSGETIAEFPAKRGGVEVLVLNVFEEFDVTDEGAKVTSSDFYDDADMPESVDVVVEILERAGISAVKRQEHGDPAETILSIAQEEDVDLIAMSGRSRSPSGKVLFGSVTQSVSLSASQPVVVTTD